MRSIAAAAASHDGTIGVCKLPLAQMALRFSSKQPLYGAAGGLEGNCDVL